MILINGFMIDAALTETHTLESDVTAFPVESGSMVTDNVRPKPRTVEIDGIVTDTPLPGAVANARGTLDAKGNFAHAPSDDALAALEAIYLGREPVEIVTELKTYPNMVMSSLTIPRDADTGHALQFNATFTEVIFITNNRTLIKVAPPLDTGLGGKKDLGNKVVYDVHDPGLTWHHSVPETDSSGVVHQGTEHLGTSSQDLRNGKAGLYHDNGIELTGQELDEYNRDMEVWANTHDNSGNQVPLNPPGTLPNTPNGLGVGLNGFSDSGGTTHSTQAVFQQGDGTWVDSAGQPVVYSPGFGNWIEPGDF
jgi:hypothetical protein